MPVDLYSIRYIDCSEWEKSIRGTFKFSAFIVPHDDLLKQVCPYDKIPLDVSLVHVADYSQYFDIHDNPRALLSIQAPSSKRETNQLQQQSKDNSSLSFHPLDYVFSSEIRYELFLYCDDQLLLQRFISPYEWIPNSQKQGKHVDQTIGHYNQLKIQFKFVSEGKASATLKRREKLKSSNEIAADCKRRKLENTSNEINNQFYQIQKITFHFSLWDY